MTNPAREAPDTDIPSVWNHVSFSVPLTGCFTEISMYRMCGVPRGLY